MITKEIARLIFNCYSEIENSEKMIQVMKDAVNEKGELELKDSWNNSKHLTLNIPRKDGGSYSVYQVPHEVALDTLAAHIENNNKELERLKGICKIQLA